jgi:hypothetical protein
MCQQTVGEFENFPTQSNLERASPFILISFVAGKEDIQIIAIF